MKIKPIYILCALVFGGQSLTSLPDLAFSFFLKNLGLTVSQIMYIGALIMSPWVLKPLYSYWLDVLWTKKHWLIISIVLSILTCFGLCFKLPLWIVISLMFLSSCGLALRSVTTGGLSSELGKENNTTTQLSSVRNVSITIVGVLVAICSGFIADHSTYRFAYLLLLPFFAIMLFFSKDLKIGTTKPEQTHWKELFKHKRFLYCLAFIFFYNFNPSFGTALYFQQIDIFRWSNSFIGILSAVGSILAVLGALFYNRFGKEWEIKRVLVISVWIGATTTLCFLYYTPISAIILSLIMSFLCMIIEIITIAWMMKVSLKGLETVSFSCLCASSNLAGFLSGITGAFLLDKIHLNNLILLSAGTSFLCLIFIPKIFTKEP